MLDVEDVDEVEELDEVDELDELDELEELDVVLTLTFGPVALQVDCARMMSIPRRVRRTPLTVIVAVPGVLVTICSFKVSSTSVGTPATGMVTGTVWPIVGFVGRPGAPTIVVVPAAPLPSARQVVVMTPRFCPPRTTLATLAPLVANPRWFSPVTFPPWVHASRRPRPRRALVGSGTMPVVPVAVQTGPDGAKLPEPMGPNAFVASVAEPATVGVNGDPSMLAAVAEPATAVTSAVAGDAT